MGTRERDCPPARCSSQRAADQAPGVGDIDDEALVGLLDHESADIRTRAVHELERRILPPPFELDIEPLLRRIALDDREAALGLLALLHHQPIFAAAVSHYIGHVLADRDELVLRLSDAAVRAARQSPEASQ